MKATDLHWAAGFLEGEGCFTPNNYGARMLASQVNKEPLVKLQTMMGGGIRLQSRIRPVSVKGRVVKKASPIYRWCLFGKAARPFLIKLLPLMSARRQKQIKISLRGKV